MYFMISRQSSQTVLPLKKTLPKSLPQIAHDVGQAEGMGFLAVSEQ